MIGKEAAMGLQIRRVVTGHTADGRAKVEVDEIAGNVISNRPGAASCVVWSTKGFPVDNDGFHDPTSGSFKTTVEDGTVFRVVRYQSRVSSRAIIAPIRSTMPSLSLARSIWSSTTA
jgi:hypothetical protein